jgi:surfeit locus 1 family protein
VGPAQNVAIVGNLHWPDEIDSYTPAPDLVKNLWFARDVDAMAAHLGTEALLVVARQSDEVDTNVTPLPVSITGIPNDHLNYAITWYSLAVVWLAMSGALIWRNRQS